MKYSVFIFYMFILFSCSNSKDIAKSCNQKDLEFAQEVGSKLKLANKGEYVKAVCSLNDSLRFADIEMFASVCDKKILDNYKYSVNVFTNYVDSPSKKYVVLLFAFYKSDNSAKSAFEKLKRKIDDNKDTLNFECSVGLQTYVFDFLTLHKNYILLSKNFGYTNSIFKEIMGSLEKIVSN